MQENPFQEERQGRNVDNLMKVGMGYDVHRLTENRNLILGGVKIPWEKGLLGHSDADVLIHAIMDALLGAAALGDIGQHFIDFYVTDTFQKINWKHDVFDAEYLTKKTKEEQEYEAVVRTLSGLHLKKNALLETGLNRREYIQKEMDLDRKNVVENLRRFFYEKEKME